MSNIKRSMNSVRGLIENLQEMVDNDSPVTLDTPMAFGLETKEGVRVLVLNAIGTVEDPDTEELLCALFLNLREDQKHVNQFTAGIEEKARENV